MLLDNLIDVLIVIFKSGYDISIIGINLSNFKLKSYTT